MKNKRVSVLFIVVFFLSVTCVFFGISYSIFTYFGDGQTTNIIKTGKIVFSYSDEVSNGDGIDITDAFPIPDSEGMLLSRNNEYFDFSVSAYTTSSDLEYEIAVLKKSESTLDDDYIKVYLTYFEGNDEKPTPLTYDGNRVLTYAELNDTTNRLLNGKTVYYGNVIAGEVAYGQNFRLRMWIKDENMGEAERKLIDNKKFKLKVNVAASSIN